ncbi:MAG: hypothetical protein JWO98_102 [Frankiales bacterium]|nr:hypothetical protein [Frankiales bacterium]
MSARLARVNENAAALLGVTTAQLTDVAQTLWGRSFAAERAARCPKSGPGRVSFVEAGVVTQGLMAEVTAAIAEGAQL